MICHDWHAVTHIRASKVEPRQAVTDPDARLVQQESSMQQLRKTSTSTRMVRALRSTAAAVLCVAALSAPNFAYAAHGGGGGHGGGGFHGGGFHGGGFHGGSHAGGFHAGGFHAGAFHGGGFQHG